MNAVVQAYMLPKAGNAVEEYEDACWPLGSPAQRVSSLRLAVADGATETSFSGPWARLLTKAYCLGRLAPDKLQEGLPKLEQIWRRYVGKKPLPWYAEQKLESGAFAAIVGVEIIAEERCWTAFAVGDCCVFHTRGESILNSFPIDKAELFDNRPLLLSSLARSNQDSLKSVKVASGQWEPGDTFYLMSDAMAAWFLKFASLPDGDAVYYVKGLSSQAAFAELVELQRKDISRDGTPMMRNDDVTLLVCTVT